MENKIVTMANSKFGTVRKIYEGDKVIFCGADVAKALGYTNSRKALADHCKGVTKRYTPTNGGEQQMSFIPEADVYRLICHSELPSALEFEKWVFEDVVPKAVNEQLPPKPKQPAIETAEYHYFPKTLNGEPVITIDDFEHFAGISRNSIGYHVKKQCKLGEDYLLLKGRELFRYKNENRGISRLASELIVLKASAVRKLLQYFGLSVEIPMIEEKKAETELARTPAPRMVNTDECIVALNVLRYLKHTREERQKEFANKENNGMVERYRKEISAVDIVIANVGTFVSLGY